ncbi:glycosyltransferase [Alistipes sp.]|uniref:glycosyltransferase n=1 Tax=Alistipes sp. TaxID=1872444 RepID=UPI000E82C07D|nr:glycosyltransferase [Alistipes sp.]HBX90376.1 glycosyl transferase family 2 [Alistipes sp.]HCN12898.1 glycosyl transferase family 2 [Alistipes sp.]
MIRLSLIIATYNRSAQLAVTLRSVAAQQAPRGEWECVVVDNNSTDDTAACVARFAAEHPSLSLRCVGELRQGLSYARNRGIAESRGELIAVIDDDERIVPGFVGAYLDFFDARPEAAAAGGPIVAEYPTGRPRWMSRWTERPIANPMYFGSEARLFPAGRIPGGGNMAFRRSTVGLVGDFDPALGRSGRSLIGGEESDFFERMRRRGLAVWYVPGAVMHHIIPAEKLTDDYFRRLCYNVGVSQRRRSEAAGRWGVVRALAVEALKWAATLLLVAALRPVQWRRLVLMRWRITCGLAAPTER